jgi:hypothetical protein
MQWYYSKNSTQLGPVEQGEMIAKISSGEITASDLVWREGMADWLPCGQVPELRATVPLGQPQPLGGPAAGGPLSPYTPPHAALAHAPLVPVPSNGKATASLVLGIVSTVFSLCSCYGMVVSFPCGILAVVFGSQVRTMARTRPELAGELGKVQAGVITGWIGLGISCAWLLFIVIMGLIGGFSGGFSGNPF